MDNKEGTSSKRNSVYIILFGLFIIVSILSMIFLSVGVLNVDTQAGKLFGAAGFFAALGCKKSIKEAVYHFSWSKLAEILSVYVAGLLGCYIAVKLGIQGTLVALVGIGIGVVICALLLLFFHFIFKKGEKTDTLLDSNLMPGEASNPSSTIEITEPKTKYISEKENKEGNVKIEDNSENTDDKRTVNIYAENDSVAQEIIKVDEPTNVHEGNSIQQAIRLQDIDTSETKDAKPNNSNSQKKEKETQKTKNLQKNNTKEIIFKAHNKIFITLICLSSILVLCGIIVYSQFSLQLRYRQAREYIRNGNVSKGETILINLANKGNAEAANTLGTYYWMGDTLKYNKNAALKYLEKSAEGGDTIGIYRYGLVLARTGQIKKGISYLKKSLNLGVEKANIGLAEIYGSDTYYGYRNPYYNLSALKQYAQQISDSISDKYFWLGNYYANSEYYNSADQQEGYEKAYYWFRKGADMGDGSCMDNLGWMYYYGNGVHVNKSRAMGYFKKALEVDDQDDYANYYVGLILIQQNNVDSAKKFLRIAADNGNEDAQAALAKLEM